MHNPRKVMVNKMKSPFLIKICVKCGRLLVANKINFSKKKNGKYGLRAECKKCDKIINKEYRETHKKEAKEYHKSYREKNKEKLSKYRKQYYEDNIDKFFNNSNKRRQMKELQGRGITKEQWIEMMEFFDWKCAYSGLSLDKNNRSIDHIIPLNNEGLNEPWNCAPMLKVLNVSKRDRDMITWYKQKDFFDIDRLMKIYEWQEYAFGKWGEVSNSRKGG